MPDSTTPNYGWAYPTVNADSGTWGATLNATIVAIDAQVKANASSGASILYGNGAGGSSNVTVGTGLSFSGGTLGCTVTAGVSSINGRSGPVTLSTTDIPGLGNAAEMNAVQTGVGNLTVSYGSFTAGNFAAFANNLGTIQDSGYGPGNIVTSVNGRHGAVTLASGDISGLGSLATSSNGNALNAGSMAARNVTIQSGGAPSGGSNGDIFFIY